MQSTRTAGAKAENLSVQLLKEKGYKIVTTNYSSKNGEIDIIAKEGGDLVFVEVKARSNLKFGYPEEAVTESKLYKIKKTADYYIKENNLDYKNIRIDVVSLLFSNGELIREKIITHVF